VKYTYHQLKEKTNAELNEICALSQGWTLTKLNINDTDGRIISPDGYVWMTDDNIDSIVKTDYSPTTDVLQAIALSHKHELHSFIHENDECGVTTLVDNPPYPAFALEHIKTKSSLVAMVIGSILVAQEIKSMTDSQIIHTAFEGEVHSRKMINTTPQGFSVETMAGKLHVNKLKIHGSHRIGQQYHTERSFNGSKHAAINYATIQIDDKQRHHRVEIEKLEEKRRKLVQGD